jgi:hypothetical protein
MKEQCTAAPLVDHVADLSGEPLSEATTMMHIVCLFRELMRARAVPANVQTQTK